MTMQGMPVSGVVGMLMTVLPTAHIRPMCDKIADNRDHHDGAAGEAPVATGTRNGTAVTAAEVAARIREAISAGDLVPNQRLIEADLAEAYGASRGHVRTALGELTVEG
ncbi:MAG TPA: GntR family transcriptional regulator, partial [Citricoccus sp.]